MLSLSRLSSGDTQSTEFGELLTFLKCLPETPRSYCSAEFRQKYERITKGRLESNNENSRSGLERAQQPSEISLPSLFSSFPRMLSIK